MIQNLNSLKQSFDDESLDYDSETTTFHHLVSEYVVLQNILDLLNTNKNTLILDSGGGTGKYTLALSKLGYTIELCDISPKSIQIAQKKFQANNLIIKAAEQNSEKTNYTNDTFDFIMLNGAVLSYTPDPEQLIRETYRILKPNGIIVFDFFNTIGWSIEISNPEEVYKIINSDIYYIEMPDWKYPARLMSINYVESLLTQNGFYSINKKGLIRCLYIWTF